MNKRRWIILKRLFTGYNKHVLTSNYMPSYKYISFIRSYYYNNTGSYDYKVFKTKKEAIKYSVDLFYFNNNK